MSEMVERVAKAIAAEFSHLGTGWDEIARAAIAAMREPTEAMKSVEGVHWGYSCHVCGGLKEGWQAMIDEALKP